MRLGISIVAVAIWFQVRSSTVGSKRPSVLLAGGPIKRSYAEQIAILDALQSFASKVVTMGGSSFDVADLGVAEFLEQFDDATTNTEVRGPLRSFIVGMSEHVQEYMATVPARISTELMREKSSILQRQQQLLDSVQ